MRDLKEAKALLEELAGITNRPLPALRFGGYHSPPEPTEGANEEALQGQGDRSQSATPKIGKGEAAKVGKKDPSGLNSPAAVRRAKSSRLAGELKEARRSKGPRRDVLQVITSFAGET